MSHKPLLFVGSIAAASAFVTTGNAAIVQDTFNSQSPGALNGQGGGTGDWSENWGGGSSIVRVGEGDGTVDLVAPGATNFALTQSGTAQSVSANTVSTTFQRQSNRGITGGFTNTTWFSVLQSTETENSRPGVTFNGSGFSITNPRFGLNPNDADNPGVDDVGIFVALDGSTNTTFSSLNLSPETGDTVLILGRIDFNVSGTNDVLSLWANPDVTNISTADFVSTSLGTGDWFGNSVDRVGVYAFHTAAGAADNGLVDFLTMSDRVTAFQDVTGVPEPASAALFTSLGALALVFRRRR